MDKLSRLQRTILITLLDPEQLSKTQQDRNKWLYEYFFNGDTQSARASLSRAHRRLEERGLIQRVKRRWTLTEMDPTKSPINQKMPGALIAFLEYSEVAKAKGNDPGDEGE